MRRGAKIGSISLIILVTSIPFFLSSPKLAPQYLAPQFQCSCQQKMVMEFIGGKVRLHNMTHSKYYEFGTFETNGAQLIWHLPEYNVDLSMEPGRFGLRLLDKRSNKQLHFDRCFTRINTSTNILAKQKIKDYIKTSAQLFDDYKPTTD